MWFIYIDLMVSFLLCLFSHVRYRQDWLMAMWKQLRFLAYVYSIRLKVIVFRLVGVWFLILNISNEQQQHMRKQITTNKTKKNKVRIQFCLWAIIINGYISTSINGKNRTHCGVIFSEENNTDLVCFGSQHLSAEEPPCNRKWNNEDRWICHIAALICGTIKLCWPHC